jgi:hypothetical protein
MFRLQEATKKGKLLNQYSLENIMRVRMRTQLERKIKKLEQKQEQKQKKLEQLKEEEEGLNDFDHEKEHLKRVNEQMS